MKDHGVELGKVQQGVEAAQEELKKVQGELTGCKSEEGAERKRLVGQVRGEVIEGLKVGAKNWESWGEGMLGKMMASIEVASSPFAINSR